MTISNTVASVTSAGNGATTLWPYAFKIPDAGSVTVTVIDSSGVETKISNSAYTITGLGSDSGGTVTYPLSGAALASGYSLRIDRNVALTQTAGFSNQSGLINSLIEAGMDKLTMIAQDTRSVSARAITAFQGILAYVSTAEAAATTAAASATAAAASASAAANSETVAMASETAAAASASSAASNAAAVDTALAIANLTPSALLASIKTVDGSSSGLDADLVWGTTPSAIGLSLLASADQAAGRTALALGSAATRNVGTAAGNVVALTGSAALPSGLTALSKMWASTEQVYTIGGTLTLAHDLGATPTLVQAWLKCVTAEQGYAAGDMYPLGVIYSVSGTFIGGVLLVPSATEIFVRFPGASYGLAAMNKSTGVYVGLTAANWHLIVRAYA